MELSKHICTQLTEKTNAFTQITLDDDYIVRDNKPDVVHVIYTKGNVILEDIKEGNQVVWITGKLHFSSLYQSDDEERRLESVTGEIPFQEKLTLEDVVDMDELSVDVSIEDLSVGIINSRKLTVRAVLNIFVRDTKTETINLSSMVQSPRFQQKTKDVPVLCLVEEVKDTISMQKEMILPNARTNIGQLIFYQVDFRNEEILLQDDAIVLQMDAQVWVLYRSETTGEYECFETNVPLRGEIDCKPTQGDEIFWANIRPLEIEMEPRGDYDGETRMLGMDLTVSVDVQIYREENCEVLEDAYSLDSELHMVREDVPFNQLLVKNISKIRLMEQDRIEQSMPKILQICGSSGSISIDHIQKRENGIQVEGLLSVHILYNTTDDAKPFAHTMSQIPFEQFIEVDDMTEKVNNWIDAKIELLQVNLLDNMEYEIKAVIEIGLFVVKKVLISNITTIREEALDMEMLKRQPGMVGCVRRDGEDLWDIAKKYHATEENIIEIGDKVLVVKQVF